MRHDSRGGLRFAVAPVLSPERTADTNLAIADTLSSRLGRLVRLVQRKTYAEVNELLRRDSVQVAIIGTGAYLQALRTGDRFEAIAVPVCEEGPVSRSLVLVRSDGPCASFADLRGRRFAFSDPASLSGHTETVALLLASGEDPARYFSGTTFTYSHDGCIRALLDGVVDGAAVDSLVHDFEVRSNSALSDRVRVVHRSGPLPISPVVVPGAIEPALREALRAAFLSMHETPQGRGILEPLGIRRFQAPDSGVYERELRRLEPALRYLGP